ncbi:FAD-dependent oxidoreductase [Aliiroseovarius sp. YM-037]|uniref:FAD-dependent oxidoreductase n=1 Tax=Aliiroseovarius sp. YM-037 TaxID=3341728 RepID=UPI003A7F8AEF
MKNYDLIIAGAGFAGIYSAWRMAGNGARVALVEASDKIGGNLYSGEWNGYFIDNGTHNFDIRTPLGDAFFTDILRDNILIFTDQTWATVTQSTWTQMFEFPDFSHDSPDIAAKALDEMHALRSTPRSDSAPEDYLGWYAETYGQTLSQLIAPMIRKLTGSDPAAVSVDAAGSLTMFRRPKLGTDAEMIALKQSAPFWDDRLGVSLMSGDARFAGASKNLRFAYPARQGLRGFCDSALQRLETLGVDVLTSSPLSDIKDKGDGVVVTAGKQKLRAAKLFWSLPEALLADELGLNHDLKSIMAPVGTCFFAFEVAEDAIEGPDYLQDYSADRLPFRYSKPGVYGNQTKPDGHTLVMAEVPCHPKDIKATLTEENSAAAFKAMVETGYLKPGTRANAAHQWGHPVAYTLPKVGWRPAFDAAQADIRAVSDKIIGIDFGYRGRASFMSFFDAKLETALS